MDSTNLCTCAEDLAMASVPMQEWCEPYDFTTALSEGTIFPCLNLIRRVRCRGVVSTI